MDVSRPAPGGTSTVEVWVATLSGARGALSRCEHVLAPDEAERLTRLKDDKARLRFLLGRGLLRLLLAEKLGEAPEKLRFAYNPFGKPVLDRPPGAAFLAFSLSHSEEKIAVAVAHGPSTPAAVGVDVEWTAAARDCDAVVARFGTEREQREYAAIAPELRRPAFYRWWTRKEALVKAMGTSLARGLGSIDVPFGEGRFHKVEWGERPGAPREWLLVTGSAGPDYVLTLAVGLGPGAVPFSPFSAVPGGEPFDPSWVTPHPTLPLSCALRLSF